ncbi:unnamed protein product [Tuber aestivum]|uniref:Uncharacterized protein n=1 Tax=Tuber aestivum TaxID=59557 RepID=A0A292PUF6_9PEZI|nr:unnamed protein product [Tuber aestivum]
MRPIQGVDLATEFDAGSASGFVQVQRTFKVYVDKLFFHDLWYQFQVWLQGYKQIPGFYGLYSNMSVTPNAVQQGVLKGRNILGMEALYFGLTFNNPSDTDTIFSAFTIFVESMMSLAEQRNVIEAYGEGNINFLCRVKEDYNPLELLPTLSQEASSFPPPDIRVRPPFPTVQDRLKMSLSYWGGFFCFSELLFFFFASNLGGFTSGFHWFFI